MPLRRRRAATLAVAISLVVASMLIDGSGVRPARVDATGPAAVIVGDSLTGGNARFIEAELQRGGLGSVRVEGLSARRIAQTFEFQGRRDSGIDRIRTLRSNGVDPDLWVIQLGTNDLFSIEHCGCANRIVFALALIRSLVDEIGPDASIAWVTVHDRDKPDVADDFNTAIFLAAFSHPRMTMMQWKRHAVDRPEWFLDHVHPNIAGARAFAQMYTDEIGGLLARPFNRDAPQIGLHRAERTTPQGPIVVGAAHRAR